MSGSEKVYKRIESSGVKGVRRVDLMKRHGNKVRKDIQELLEKGLIFTDKNKGAVTFWTKESYVQYIVNSRVSGITSEVEKKISTMRTDMNRKVAGMVTAAKAPSTVAKQDDNGGQNGNNLTLDQFKMEFDRTIAATPTAIGWVELGMIRENICDKYGMSKQDFYSLASQLFDQFNNGYELSSGGNEGVIVRGLLHGFVRRI